MKKLINRPEDLVREELEGMAIAHAGQVRISLEPAYVVRADAPVQPAALVHVVSRDADGLALPHC